LFVLALLFVGALCLKDLPWHARGGLAARTMPKTGPNVQDMPYWYVQDLDHNNPGQSTFLQRYYVDSTMWDTANGPVFFEIGGEGPAEGTDRGFIRTLAKTYKALLVTLEHRFYGVSVPSGGLSTSNLKYLSSQQALADVASVINYMKQTLSIQGKFVTFGGSYSGALSAWFRLKYPHLTVGSLSSSGVVNAVFNFTDFDVQVAEAIGTTCTRYIQATTQAFEDAVAAGQGTAARNLFGMDPTTSNGDFFYMMADSAAMADQYGNKAALCNWMAQANMTDPNSLMQSFANFTNTFWGKDFGSNCFYDTNCLKNTPSKWQPTSRSWRWQKCSELAYFQNAPQSNSLRSTKYVTQEYNLNQCVQIFGSVIPNTDPVNLYYGGADIQATNVFFSDFSDDPWQRASVRKANNPQEPYGYVQCDGCGHCRDFHAPSPSDPAPLQVERANFASYLAKWLSE